jgi:hemoglobin-like flavoprotein
MSIQLLRDSYELVTAREPALLGRCYDILFARHPQLRPRFGRTARPAPEKLLAGALVAVLAHLEDAERFTSTLRALGAKHVAYGVTEEMYAWVGECLLAAIAEAAGPHWSAELEAAWSAAYAAIAGAMLDGARAATTLEEREVPVPRAA